MRKTAYSLRIYFLSKYRKVALLHVSYCTFGNQKSKLLSEFVSSCLISTFTRALGNFNTCFIIIMMIPAPFPSHLLHLFNLSVCCCRYSILISSDDDDPRSHLIREMTFAVQFACFFIFFNARDLLLTLANIKFSDFFQITNITKISCMLILVVYSISLFFL